MPMIHLSQQQITTGRVPPIELSDQLTVAVRFRSTGSGAERSQALVAQWTLASDFDAFSSYDATHTDGLVCAGYMGGAGCLLVASDPPVACVRRAAAIPGGRRDVRQ